MIDRLPPHNSDAETALISAVLLDNTMLPEVLDSVGAADFYAPSHQKIFDAALTLFGRGDPVDLVTVKNLLTERKEIERVAGEGYRGVAYLAWLSDAAPRAANAAYYAKIVRDKAVLRRLIDKAAAITRKCYEDSGDTDDVLNFAEQSVFGLADDRLRPSISQLAPLIDQNIDDLERRQDGNSALTGVPTGFVELDFMLAGLQPTDLVILAARPSMGKTGFALNIARNAAVDAGVPVAIFSLEMASHQLSMRLLCSEARVDSSRFRTGLFSQKDWEALTRAAGDIADAPIFIDDSANIGVLEILAKCRRLKAEKKLGLVIVDYLQLMRGRVAERRDLEISEISRSLKALAKELHLPVLALSQLNRKLEERSDKRPMLSDLRESGSLEQDADVVMFIYRDEVYNKGAGNPNRGTAEIIVGKHRNGPVGTAVLSFHSAHTRFGDRIGQ